MNKKIILSLSVIGAVAAIAIGGTIAYFSDTETSTGNTFTAGTIDLTVSSTGIANGATCTFANGQVADQAILSCSDVKPGDSGTSKITFNISSNTAWACMKVRNIVNGDGTCVEPEIAAETANGTSCVANGTSNGELAAHFNITVWDDADCDGAWDSGESKLSEQPVSYYLGAGGTSFTVPISTPADPNSLTNAALSTGNHCVGLSWNVPGATTGNDVQSDILSADLQFYIEQSRNNGSFTCANK
jgi:predicted ribosomally synthesized peptide with SipW-like signal peptide